MILLRSIWSAQACLRLQRRKQEGGLKTDFGTGLQPLIPCSDYFLGLRPRLIWFAPLALSNIGRRIRLSAEGAASYQPGAEPRE
jgi:hypothetical protein